MGEERPDGAPAEVPIAEAAERLDISTEAARKRVQRGTLPGRKVDGAWFVEASALPPPASAGRPDATAGRQDGEPIAAGQRPDDGQDAGRTPPEPAPPVDLRPLADLIAELHRENARLTEAAAVWQVRARQAEERLEALAAGDVAEQAAPNAGDARTASPAVPGAAEPAGQGEDAPPWWRRWLRALGGRTEEVGDG